jgi:two-component system OmpR family sensor kinase
MLDANLAIYKMQIVKTAEEQESVLDKGTILKREGFESLSASLMYDKNGFYTQNKVTKLRATMIRYNKLLYFHIQTKNAGILIKDEQLTPYNYLNILYSFSTIFMIISASFILVLQKLRPLIRLRRKIALFGDGDMKISFETSSCDEIGLVSNELESTRRKINSILESRTLFLRNIMHELKTPIAKGTIATQMLDSEKQRNRFSSIFNRLEALVIEFALIEEVTSLDDKCDFNEYRLIDIIDGAIDMAMVERDVVSIDIHCDVKLHANYRLYTTAIKNMIDNAMKYSNDAHINILMRNGELCFENRGDCLSQPLSYYIEPFTKQNPSKNSFGLGLYLVDSILKAHGQVLAHEYEDGVNRFIFA